MLSRNVQTMLNRRGQDAALVKKVYGSYNPATGTTSSTDTEYTVKAYFGDYKLEEMGTYITLGDRKVLIGTVDTSGVTIPEPDSEDTITSVGDTVVIKNVQKIYNSDTLVCYICQVRE